MGSAPRRSQRTACWTNRRNIGIPTSVAHLRAPQTGKEKSAVRGPHLVLGLTPGQRRRRWGRSAYGLLIGVLFALIGAQVTPAGGRPVALALAAAGVVAGKLVALGLHAGPRWGGIRWRTRPAWWSWRLPGPSFSGPRERAEARGIIGSDPLTTRTRPGDTRRNGHGWSRSAGEGSDHGTRHRRGGGLLAVGAPSARRYHEVGGGGPGAIKEGAAAGRAATAAGRRRPRARRRDLAAGAGCGHEFGDGSARVFPGCDRRPRRVAARSAATSWSARPRASPPSPGSTSKPSTTW